MDFQDKRVTVVGLGISGIAAAELLNTLGAIVTVTDEASDDAVREQADKLRQKGIKVEVGKHSKESIGKAELIVVSPGVVPDSLPFTLAKSKGIPLIGELDLGVSLCNVPIIAVTGTNGKSTTVTLTGKILEAAGRKIIVAGNIGNPLCRVVQAQDNFDFIVLEVSSFQLETMRKFKPFIAVVLNVSDDHMNRYNGSFSNYLQTKQRLLLNQAEGDFSVLNVDDTNLNGWDCIRADAGVQTLRFSRQKQLREGVSVEGGNIVSRWQGEKLTILSCDQLGIKGAHNLENALAVTAIALICQVEPRVIARVLKGFSGLPHRSEFVDEVEGVKFINDSKGTNVGAAVKSLEGFTEPVILIAGGSDKGADYSLLRDVVKDKVKTLILLGEVKNKLKEVLTGFVPVIEEVSSMEDAVKRAYCLANKGDTVLLSPACASFDMFENFEERGHVFRTAVENLR